MGPKKNVTATIAVQHRRVTQVFCGGQDDRTNDANRFAEMGCTSELTEVLFAYREKTFARRESPANSCNVALSNLWSVWTVVYLLKQTHGPP